MVALPRRTFLSRRAGLSSMERVYRTRDGIEADEVEGYDVTRRRVLFDEVILVTMHREIGWAFVVTVLVVLTVFAPWVLIALVADTTTGAVVALLTVFPLIVLLLLRLIMGVDVVTVQGPRSRIRIPFWFRKDRAREVFRLVTRMAREHQQRRARPRVPPPAPGPGASPAGPPPEPAA